MTFVIEDGKGHGKKAAVRHDHSLLSFGGRMTMAERNSLLDGNLFIANMAFQTISTTEGLVLWLKNTSEDKKLLVHGAVVGWGGGDTNYDRYLKFRLELLSTTPDTNESEVTVLPWNYAPAIPAPVECLAWDGGGTGMTGHSANLTFLRSILSKGHHRIDLGGINIPPTVSLGINLEGEEAGLVSASFLFSVGDMLFLQE